MAYIQDTYALLDAATGACLMTIPVSMVNPPLALGHEIELYHIVTGASLGWWKVQSCRRRQPFREDKSEPGVRVPLQGAEIEVRLWKI